MIAVLSGSSSAGDTVVFCAGCTAATAVFYFSNYSFDPPAGEKGKAEALFVLNGL